MASLLALLFVFVFLATAVLFFDGFAQPSSSKPFFVASVSAKAGTVAVAENNNDGVGIEKGVVRG